MKLSIVSQKKFCFYDGRYWTYGGFGEYVNSFTPYFDEINLCVPVTDKELPGMYPMEHPKLTFTHLPSYDNELQLLCKWPLVFFKMRRAISDSDVVNPRIPDMTGVSGCFWSYFYKKPHFVSMQSDWLAFLKAPGNTKTKGVIKKGLYGWIKLYLWFESYITKYSLCFPQGRELYNRYSDRPAVYEWASSSIHADDVVSFKEFPLNKEDAPLYLLHVGRITRAKGHCFLIKALYELNFLISPRKVFLTCIGKQDPALLGELKDLAESLKVNDQINWIDTVEHGHELWSYFDRSDVFVFSSIWEGTPKVLVEAMARGLPIVSSDVGGIKSLIQHEKTGLLVPPQKPRILAAAISRMIEDNCLRTSCIKSGLAFAKMHTVETQTHFMLQKFLEKNRVNMARASTEKLELLLKEYSNYNLKC
ncbi:glycosyltransferase [Motiliproteus sp.]|uniref:glycosyltransferase n=1 Tax=Motiliproteus sp. TaxID=1898955 RepID=UPI003BAA6CE6